MNVDYYSKLKEAYNNAVENKAESFFLGKDEYLTTYAKYLLEYMENYNKQIPKVPTNSRSYKNSNSK